MAELSLNVQSRELSTKGANNKLRRDGFVPGILYSTETEPTAITVSEVSLKPFVYTSETHIISLNIDNKDSQKAILKDIQFHPITDRIVHVDLLGLTAGHKIIVPCPVVLNGTSKGVREGGMLNVHVHKLEIECLPKDLPESIDIDISNMMMGDAVHVEDLNIEGIRFVVPGETIIVSVEKARGAEDVTAEDGAIDGSIEPEVIAKGKSDEEDGE
ncbi:MAG: 50S ribosomal protein L25 [Bacteroidetes bacterium]|nr:50S ribosomal protein L25 [Bacteroidota bacterium]